MKNRQRKRFPDDGQSIFYNDQMSSITVNTRDVIGEKSLSGSYGLCANFKYLNMNGQGGSSTGHGANAVSLPFHTS